MYRNGRQAEEEYIFIEFLETDVVRSLLIICQIIKSSKEW